MKLLTKTNLYYTLFALIIFIIGGFAFFYIIQNEIYEEIDEALLFRKDTIIKQLNSGGEKYIKELAAGGEVSINRINDKSGIPLGISDTLIFNPGEKEGEQFRRLSFITDINNTPYHINILRSVTDSDSLVDGIAMAVSIIFSLLLGGGALLNYYISKRIWKPFYSVLDKIKDYRPAGEIIGGFPASNISEFSKLNDVIERLVAKVQNDFINLKQFTENASHEIQTPLAVIKTKSEMLLQREDLDLKTLKEIMSINETATRLSKLNQALLQLMKIENLQYQESEKIDLGRLLETKLEKLNELITMKNIKLTKTINKIVFVNMNSSLADILLSNLLNNSIKHNIYGGEININLTQDSLSIKNTGNDLKIRPEKLFGRFVKESNSHESIGLGLSIVKQICDNNKFNVNYIYQHPIHEIKITF
ncbi:MAG: HAMP domain-containing sensor histidine kinase [Ignavibacteriaceae bacterium]|nr:HAMP domain-containing sensor histidine kinase [Ignavibacteriaceae bacterium]